MDKHQSKIIIFSCLLISIIFVVFVLVPKQQTTISNVSSTPTPAPAIPVALADTETSVEAPDGKFTLNMKQKYAGSSITYTFLTTDETTGIQTEIYTKTEPAGVTLVIPTNTFSSDDKYIFLKEISSSSTDYFVVKGGEALDISGPFADKYQNYVITDVTGWAGPTLVVVNTDKINGKVGPSFWFDVSSKSFIQLSDRFN
jgi:hypothetical protein